VRIIVAITLMSLSLIVQAASRTPEQALQEFYSWVLSERYSALRTAAEEKRLTAIISPRLRALMVNAVEAEKRCIDSAKGTTDKPYFFESDVFIGNWGTADEVFYGDVEPKGDEATANVTYFSVNRKSAKGARSRVEMWVVKVKMRADRGAWQIDDLEYEDGRTLTSIFSDYLLKSKEFCHS
jgi:hypothetical protein